MKKLYNTPETTLVKTMATIDLMKFTESSGVGGPAEPTAAPGHGI